MKVVFTLLILTFFQGPTPAPPNEQPDDAPVLVVKHSWTRIRYRPGWDGNPFPDPRFDPRNPFPIPRRIPDRIIEGFYYRATLKNLSQKTAVQIVWNYRFREAREGQFSNHQFFQRTKIKPGKQKELYGFARKPPTRTVSASKAGEKLEGEVIVNYIQYADGTSWQRDEPAGNR